MTREEEAFFEEFYRANFKKLVGYAFRFLQNWEDAREVTQEAFLTGLIKIEQLYASENRLGWIKSTVRKRAQNFNRVKTNRAAVTTSLEDPGLFLAAPDHYGGIDTPSAHCAELLSEQEFLLIKRIYMEGESYRDTAKEFGMTEGACRKRVERIIKKLRERWNGDN